jgi:hypothetical protein
MRFALAILAVVAVALSWISPAATGAAAAAPAGPVAAPVMTIYKSPTCGCCHQYMEYLKAEKFPYKGVDVSYEELAKIKKRYGIPENLGSCHTGIIAGYFVEGHVPLPIVRKLLAERPPILGISLPGMPSGSPGMGGRKTETWEIRAVGRDGRVTIFARY